MYKKILVTLDGMDQAECILGHVIELVAGIQGTEVTLLSVVEPYEEGAPTTSWGGVMTITQGATLVTKALNNANEYINKVAAQLTEEGLSVTPVVIQGKVAEAILDYAKENKIELIMMSTHGRSGPSRWALGSIAERVLRHSPIPVLIVSPEGCRVNY